MTAAAITGVGVLSAAGTGASALASACREGVLRLSPVADVVRDPVPDPQACLVPGFRGSDILGTKGTAFLDRSTQLALVACKLALEDRARTFGLEAAPSFGIVLGSTSGSVRSITEFCRDTYIHERPYYVNPVLMPNTVMNCAAGQAAIWYGFRGANATISAGQASSLLAVRYGMALLRQGYAEVLLVGGVEEYCAQTAWALAVADGRAARPGEGCAIFVLEREEDARARGAGTAVPVVLACTTTTLYRGIPDPAGRLARCVRDALARADVAPRDVRLVAPSISHRRENALELRAIELVLGRAQRCLVVKSAVGECLSAAGALQIAAVLGEVAAGAELPALVTSLGTDGVYACAVIGAR